MSGGLIVLIRRPDAIPSREITSRDLVLRRREFLWGAGCVTAGAALALACRAEGEARAPGSASRSGAEAASEPASPARQAASDS
ncbi:MAG TPA: hypothetical protein VEC18_01705, partial [Myxococcota bacterium]|nr:hypothetical protein [Myxococcota bacterium]